MTRVLLIASLALALAAPAVAQQRSPGPGRPDRGGPPGRAYANPSAGIAADLELARLTGEKKGRWHALRQTAAPDAVMFAPQMVLAQNWLKDRAEPSGAIKLRPYRAWSSCDGSLTVTSGARQDAGASGWYTTVWQRQPDGALRWVFDHSGPAQDALEEPEMIEAKVAECPARRPDGPPAPPPAAGKRGKPPKPAIVVFDPTSRHGRSNDGSLTWEVTVDPSGAHHFSASLLQDGEMRVFRDEKVGAPGS